MRLLNALAISLMTCLFLSCGGNHPQREGANGIYYWRTLLSLDKAERDFLKEHDVKRLYLHFFDVDSDWEGKATTPSATLQFADSIPKDLEVIPTIYITNTAMETMQLLEDEYAYKILRRINAMCKKNNISYSEIQLDCDWTKSTQKHFYRLCEAMKSRMDSTHTLSSTIRLHQLTQSPPPVDKGVLMVYNTGNMREFTTENSIFSYKDIEPYLRDDRLAKYSLPLDVAYPAYGWSLTFHKGADHHYFRQILRKTDFSPYPEIKKVGNNRFEVTSSVALNGYKGESQYLDKGDVIKVERPTAKEILKVKKIIDTQLKDHPHSNILYHLDHQQLSHYSDNEISKIYYRR